MATETAQKILLGTGVFKINDVPFGLTKGGGKFTVERKFKDIEADGDYGTVKGRTDFESEIPKLTVNGLETFNAEEISKYYPAISITADNETTPTKNTMTSTLVIADGDYVDVEWTGKTRDGKYCTIKLQNALNLSNIEWKLEDKSEVIATLEFTGTYDEATRTTPPWSVEFEA